MRNQPLFLIFVVGCLILTSCGEDSSDTTQDSFTSIGSTATSSTTVTVTEPQPTTPDAFHPIPADSVGVTGTATCTFPNAEEFTAVCQLDMSDPRVSGTEVSDNYQFYAGDEEEGDETVVSVIWVANAVLTNEEGTWRGVTQAGDDGSPCGESHYIGEGAYKGLEFHYYFCHFEDAAQLRGWIYRSGST